MLHGESHGAHESHHGHDTLRAAKLVHAAWALGAGAVLAFGGTAYEYHVAEPADQVVLDNANAAYNAEPSKAHRSDVDAATAGLNADGTIQMATEVVGVLLLGGMVGTMLTKDNQPRRDVHIYAKKAAKEKVGNRPPVDRGPMTPGNMLFQILNSDKD